MQSYGEKRLPVIMQMTVLKHEIIHVAKGYGSHFQKSIIGMFAKKKSVAGRRITSLAHVLDEEYIRDCYYSIKMDKTVGIYNISWEG